MLEVTELNVCYRRAARYDQLVTVRCWVEAVKSRQVTFGYQVVSAETGTVFVTGHTTHTCVTRQGRITTIPATWRSLLSPGDKKEEG